MSTSDTMPASKPTSGRWGWTPLGCVGVAAIWILMFVAAGWWWLASSSGVEMVWSASSGDPVPSAFRVLMFPKSGAMLRDPISGVEVGSLTRAVLNAPDELDLEQIEVQESEGTLLVARDGLAFQPADGNAADEIAALEAVIKQRVEDDWAVVSYQLRPNGSVLVVKLTVGLDDSRSEFEYEITGADVVPRKYTEVNGIKAGITGAALLPVAAIGALLGSVVLSLIYARVIERPSSRERAGKTG